MSVFFLFVWCIYCGMFIIVVVFVKRGIVIIVVVVQVVCGAFSETWYGYQIVVDWV